MTGEFLYSLVSNQKKEHMKKENKEQIVVSAANGKLRKPLEQLVLLAGFEISATDERSYETTISSPELEKNIQLVFAKPPDVSRLLSKNPKQITAGITGGDVLYEQRIEPDLLLDFGLITPWLAPVVLKLLATPNGLKKPEIQRLAELGRYESSSDTDPTSNQYQKMRATMQQLLVDSTVYTSLTRMVSEYFENDQAITIFGLAGTIEGVWRSDSDSLVIADRVETGLTAQKNGLLSIAPITELNKLGVLLSPNSSDEDLATVTQLSSKILKIPDQFGATKPWKRKPLTVEEIITNGSLRWLYVLGQNNTRDDRFTPRPLFFDESMKTIDLAKKILGAEGTLVTSDDPARIRQFFEYADKWADPVVIYLFRQALKLGGYLLIPKGFYSFVNRLIPVSTNPGENRTSIH